MADEKAQKEVIVPATEVSSPKDVAATETVVPAEEGKKRKKSSKRQVLRGRATIQCTYNNTIVTLSDVNGAVLGWSSAGHLGFKGAKKSTPYAATQIVASVAEKVKKYGLQELDVFLRGVGSGREASVRALANNGFSILSIKDLTPIPHNGCRPKRPRRI